jgi:uncharacterized coiled-coil protein SlyX
LSDTPRDGPTPLETRVTGLEELLTHQQRLLDQLNEVILRQQRELAALGSRLSRLEAAVDSVADQTAEHRTAEDERPPHY